MNFLEQQLKEAGFFQHGIADTADIRFSQEVRAMCEVNTCRKYGTTWACPPAVGTVEECKERIQQYEKMLVFTGKYDLEDSFDFEGMMASAKQFAMSCRSFDTAVKPYLHQYLMLANEGCDLCKECTYPDAPCRHPDRMFPCVESYGILVTDLAEKSGISFMNGAGVVTWFSFILYRESAPAGHKT